MGRYFGGSRVWTTWSGLPSGTRAIMLGSDLVERPLREAAARASIRHKRLGNPIVVWRDGQVVWIPAGEIEVPGAGAASDPMR
jgi:hypothetical protein